MALSSKTRFNKISNILNERFSSKWIGIIFAFFAAIFASTINVAGKTLVDPQYTEVTTLNPINLAVLLGLVTGLFFTPFAKAKPSSTKINRKTIIFIILLGITDVAAISTNFFGLSYTTATNASILTNIEFVFVIFIAVAIFREKIFKNEIIPIALIVSGAVVLPLGTELQSNNFTIDEIVYGDFLIILAAGFYAVDISIAKYVSKRASAARISQLSAFAGIPFALSLIVIFQIPFDIQLEHFPSVLYIGIFVTGLAYYFFILALRFIGAIRTILIYSSTTAFGIMFAAIFLGEKITVFEIVPLGIIGIGVYLLRNRLAKMETD